MNKQYVHRKKGRIRYYSISTRLNYNDRNNFLQLCKKSELTPSELIRDIIIDKIKFLNRERK